MSFRNLEIVKGGGRQNDKQIFLVWKIGLGEVEPIIIIHIPRGVLYSDSSSLTNRNGLRKTGIRENSELSQVFRRKLS